MSSILAILLSFSTVVAGGYTLMMDDIAFDTSSNEGKLHLVVDGNEHTGWKPNPTDEQAYLKVRPSSGEAKQIDHLDLTGLDNIASVHAIYYGIGFEEGLGYTADVTDGQVSLDTMPGYDVGLVRLTFEPIDSNKQINVGEIDYEIK